MTQTPDSNSDANGVSPPSSAAPPVGTELRESDRVSYWRTRTSEDQPPDFIGSPREVRDWLANNPPAEEGGILALEGAKMLVVQKGRACGPSEVMLDIVHESSPIDTPMPFYEFQKQAQRAVTKTPAPSIPGSSRKLRRASGDRRTVKQIMAEQRREGR